MKHPSGIRVININSQEFILVADEGNNRIAVYDKQGIFTTNLVSDKPRIQSPQNIIVYKNKVMVIQKSCFLSSIYEIDTKI